MCYHGIAPGAEAALPLPFLPLGQVPFPYQTTMHGAGRGGSLSAVLHLPLSAEVKGIRDKQDKSLKVWMHCHAILCWMLSSWKSFDAPKRATVLCILGPSEFSEVAKEKIRPRKRTSEFVICLTK